MIFMKGFGAEFDEKIKMVFCENCASSMFYTFENKYILQTSILPLTMVQIRLMKHILWGTNQSIRIFLYSRTSSGEERISQNLQLVGSNMFRHVFAASTLDKCWDFYENFSKIFRAEEREVNILCSRYFQWNLIFNLMKTVLRNWLEFWNSASLVELVQFSRNFFECFFNVKKALSLKLCSNFACKSLKVLIWILTNTVWISDT